MYIIYKQYVVKTYYLYIIYLKPRELDKFSHFKSMYKWNGKKPLTAKKGPLEELLMTNWIKPWIDDPVKKDFTLKKELEWKFWEDNGVGSTQCLSLYLDKKLQ